MLKSYRIWLFALVLCGLAFAQQPELPPGYVPTATMTMDELNSRADVIDEAGVEPSVENKVSENTNAAAPVAVADSVTAASSAVDSSAANSSTADSASVDSAVASAEESSFEFPVFPVVISALGTIAFVVLAIIF